MSCRVRQYDMEHATADDNRGKHGKNDTQAERKRKAPYNGSSECIQYESRKQAGNIRCVNRAPCRGKSFLERKRNGLFMFEIFPEAFEYQYVRINSHSDRHDESRNAGKRKRNGEEFHNGKE